MTAIVVKVAAAALKQFPKFNASLDLASEEVIYKKYVHIGVAVDTERGLLVPVIRDADRKSLAADRRRADRPGRACTRRRSSACDEMQGASFTITNLGGLGTTYFSPIVTWPQVAILGVGRAEQQAVWGEGEFEPRLILPLSSPTTTADRRRRRGALPALVRRGPGAAAVAAAGRARPMS